MIKWTRREFIRNAAAALAGAAVPASLSAEEVPFYLRLISIPSSITPKFIEDNFAHVITKEQEASLDTLIPSLHRAYRTHASRGEEMVQRTKTYAIPASPDRAKALFNYCQDVVPFANKVIKVGKVPSIDWRIPDKGVDYSKQLLGLGFACEGFCLQFELDVKGKKDIYQVPVPEYGSGTGGRISPMEYYAIVSAGPGFYHEPFSEVLPFITFEATKKYAEVDAQAAKIADETINEAVAFQLSINYAMSKGMATVLSTVRNAYRNSIRRNPTLYGNVPKAIKWIVYNGINNAYTLYLNNPLKFMRAISK